MKNNMILNCKIFRKIIKGLMLVVALLVIVPVEAREQVSRSRRSQEQDDGVEVLQRPSQRRTTSSLTTAASARSSRGPQSRTPQGRYAAAKTARRQQLSRRQQQERKPTEKITPENVLPAPAPGSQQPQSDADKWQEELDTLETKEPLVILEDIKNIREERPTLTKRQKAELNKLEKIAKLEIKLANLESQQSGQPAGTQTGPENKPQQQETQTVQAPAPVGGAPFAQPSLTQQQPGPVVAGGSLSSTVARTSPFLVPQAPVTEQQVKPVVTAETKPQRLGPIQKAWQEMPSASQMVYGVFGGDPNILKTPKVVPQPAPAKPVGKLKQAYRDLPSFSSVLYYLGGGRAPDVIKPQVPSGQTDIQSAAVQEQPQPAPISEKDWREFLDGLVAEQPSQDLVNDIEEWKQSPGLSNAQREDLERFQQSIKESLNPFIAKQQAPVPVTQAQTQPQQQIQVPARSSSLPSTNPFLQTPTPPRALPAQLPSNPFMTPRVVPKGQEATQKPTVANPFSIPQKKRMSEAEWKQTKTNFSRSTFAFPSQNLIDRIEEIKKTYALSGEQLEWLNNQENVIRGLLLPISEEKWQKIRAALILASTQPSQEWVDKIEEIKNNPRLTQTQRDELVGFQQQMIAGLAKNPFVQVPQPPAVEQKLHPLTGRPLDTKPKKPGPLQNLLPDWSAFY